MALVKPTDLAKLNVERLAAKVSSQKNIRDSSLELVVGIADLVRGAGTEPIPLNALISELHASADDLAHAVTSNTGEHVNGTDTLAAGGASAGTTGETDPPGVGDNGTSTEGLSSDGKTVDQNAQSAAKAKPAKK